MKIGVLALQGAFREHLDTLARHRRRGRARARAGRPRRRQRPDPARRREHDDAPAHRALGAARADPATSPRAVRRSSGRAPG